MPHFAGFSFKGIHPRLRPHTPRLGIRSVGRGALFCRWSRLHLLRELPALLHLFVFLTAPHLSRCISTQTTSSSLFLPRSEAVLAPQSVPPLHSTSRFERFPSILPPSLTSFILKFFTRSCLCVSLIRTKNQQDPFHID